MDVVNKVGQKAREKANADLLEAMSGRRDELFSFYDSHSYKETLDEFGIPSYKRLSAILKALGYDFSRKKGNSVLKGKPSPRSHESYVAGGRKSSETQRDAWAGKTDEEKGEWSKKMADSHSSEEYKARKSKAQKEWYASLSDDDKKEYARVRGEGSKAWWDSLTEDEKAEQVAKHMEAGAGWNHERIRQTLRDRYGVSNVSQVPSVSAKAVEGMRKTCLEKYGVEWNCQLEQCKTAIGAKSSNTKPNVEFATLLDSMGIAYEREFNLGKYIYDFKVGDTLVEINPTPTHNSTWNPFGGEPLDKLYHKDKLANAEKNGYRCVMVWDWDVPEKVAWSLKDAEVVYARKCEVREIGMAECSEFVNRHHFQNDARCSVRLGLFHEGELVSVMTFGKPRYNGNHEWELIRYCSSKKVIGGASKLFRRFVADHAPRSIVSYCDRSKFKGDLYPKLGFALTKRGKPSKHWHSIRTGEHYTDNLLRQQGFSRLVHRTDASNEDLATSDNATLMREEGFAEVWDCGQDVYVWENGTSDR